MAGVAMSFSRMRGQIRRKESSWLDRPWRVGLSSLRPLTLLVLLQMHSDVVGEGKDYYELLGVERTVDDGELKKAYRKMSLELHPDKCEGDKKECEEKFIEMSSAYEVLSDAEKRKIYDVDGEEGLKDGGSGSSEHAANMFRQFFGREPDGKVKVVHQGGRMMFHEEGEPGPQENIFDNTDVEEIQSENYKAFVTDRDEPWVILFYKPTKPEYGPEVKEEYKKLGTTYKGICKVAAVNCRKERDICSQASIDKFPAVRWFPDSKDKDPEVYDEGEISAKNLGKWVSTNMPDYTTALTTKLQLKEWMEAAKGPVALLFSDKKSAPPLWKALSREFNKRATLGVVIGCDKNGVFKNELQRLYDVNIPKIIHVDPLAEIGTIAEKYESKLSTDILSLWLKMKIGKQRQSGPVAAFKEWTAERLKAGDCAETDSQFCFVWLKAGAEPVVEQAMRGLAQKYRTDPIKLMYVNTELNEGILNTFSLAERAGEDVFVAYRPKRKKFKVHEGELTLPALDSFIDGVLNGGPLTQSLKVPSVEL